MQEFIMKLENILTHGRSSSTIKTLNDYKKFASWALELAVLGFGW